MNILYPTIILSLILGSATTFFISSLVHNSSEHSELSHDHSHQDTHSHEEENTIILSPEQIKNLKIKTALAKPGELFLQIFTRGKVILHPDKLAHILPKISGIAKETHKNIGDLVKEEEILATLESSEMADIKANYLAKKEKEKLARSLLEREKHLYEKKVSAEQDFLNSKSSYEEAFIDLNLAKQKLHSFGINEEEIQNISPALASRFYSIRSPIDGTVIARHITKGEYIENTNTIYEIADLDTVWIEIAIYPKDLSKIKIGQTIHISTPMDEKNAEAKIFYLSPIIQEETITAKALAELKNPNHEWYPGSFVNIHISTENVSAKIVIPKEAIQEIEGKEFIFVKTKEGFEKRPIKTGLKDSFQVEILEGLNPEEEYAITNTFLLKAELSKNEAEHDH